MSRKQFSLFDPELLKPALINAVLKLDPRAQWRNPVMMVVWCCCVLLTIVSGVQLAAHSSSDAFFTIAVTVWLWFTLLFANMAEALAEGRSKAQAASLKGLKKTVIAHKLASAVHDAVSQPVSAES